MPRTKLAIGSVLLLVFLLVVSTVAFADGETAPLANWVLPSWILPSSLLAVGIAWGALTVRVNTLGSRQVEMIETLKKIEGQIANQSILQEGDRGVIRAMAENVKEFYRRIAAVEDQCDERHPVARS